MGIWSEEDKRKRLKILRQMVSPLDLAGSRIDHVTMDEDTDKEDEYKVVLYYVTPVHTMVYGGDYCGSLAFLMGVRQGLNGARRRTS